MTAEFSRACHEATRAIIETGSEFNSDMVCGAPEALARAALDAALPILVRAARRDLAREILALDAADRAIPHSPATNKGPYGSVNASLKRVARGEALPAAEDLRGGYGRRSPEPAEGTPR